MDNWQNGGKLIGSWSGNDPGSIWIFNDFTSYVDNQLDSYQATADKAAAVTTGTGYFYVNSEKLAAFNSLLSECITNKPTDADGANSAFSELATAANEIYNIPADGDYFLRNSYYKQYGYLRANANRQMSGFSDKATRSVWTFKKVDGGYTLQNKLTGLYVHTASGTNFTLRETPQTLTLLPANGLVGYTFIGTTGTKEMMHCNGQGGIIGWTNDAEASNWAFEDYDVNEADALAAAEAQLASNDFKTLYQNSPIVSLLSIDAEAFNQAAASMKTLQECFSYNIYSLAKNNYYRIHNVAHDKNLGINASNQPAGTDASNKDANQVWQLWPVEDGFKLYNPNAGAANENAAYISAVATSNEQGGTAPAATLTSQKEGGKYTIQEYDATAGTFKFGTPDYSSGPSVFCINMEGADYGSGDFILDLWGGDNSKFTIEKAEILEVDLKDASVGKAYATAYLPFNVTLPAEGVTAYVGGDIANGVMPVTEVAAGGAIAAKNGFILEADAATTASLTIGGADGATSTIGGTTQPVTLTDDNRAGYLLFGVGDTSKELGFFAPGSGITAIAANKAFVANDGTLQSVALKFGGATTGIGNAIGTTAEDNAPVYDLSGRRVAQPAKGGVYIKGGRKFIVK